MRDLGLDAYRFSISWTAHPAGRHAGPATRRASPSTTACSTSCSRPGIQPMATLFHWDTPLELEQRGGWRRRDTALALRRVRPDRGGGVRRPRRLLGDHQRGVHGHARGLRRSTCTRRAWARRSRPARRRATCCSAHGLAVQALRVGAGARPDRHHERAHRLRPGDRFAEGRGLRRPLRLPAQPAVRGPGAARPQPGTAAAASVRWESPSASCRAARTRDLRAHVAAARLLRAQLLLPEPDRRRPAPARARANPDGVSEAMDSAPFHLAEWPEFEQTGFGWPIAPEYLRRRARAPRATATATGCRR